MHGDTRGISKITTAFLGAVAAVLIGGAALWFLGWVTLPGGATRSAGVPRAGGGREVLFYRNPMNPAITSPAPAKDEMGMDYIPVYADEGGKPEKPKTIEEETADFFAEDGASPGVEGLAAVTLDGRGVALAGVQTAAAVGENVRRTIRTVGRVVPDETRERHVHTKVGGWVEKLHVNFSGQVVERGKPLLDLYAPELLATQEEFIEAGKSVDRLAAAGDRAGREGAERLAESARRRLELYDVPAAVVAAIAREGAPRRAIALLAPVSGSVTGKGIFEGQQVEPGMELYTVTDLSRIWVVADLYESEARAARIGQEAVFAVSYDPDRRFAGTVSYVAPVVDPESRTLKVRLEFNNADLALKPGMFGDVTFTLESAAGLSIPDSAVIDSGTRQVVFVGGGDGRYEPRLVRLGVRGEGKAQVLSGLAPGERVVVKANFLLDSESRLRSLVEQATAARK